MQTYKLYLESGPKKKKTMVHILDMLGCIAKGPTTEEALDSTPEAIRAYLRFLKRHGEAVDPDSEFETIVAEHVTEGQWLGSGDPALVFRPDLEPLTLEDAETYIRRSQWLRAEVLILVGGLTNEQIEAEPNTKDRSIRTMLEHVLESSHRARLYNRHILALPGQKAARE
jgi:predicted RNase H-like HicB family nuclease